MDHLMYLFPSLDTGDFQALRIAYFAILLMFFAATAAALKAVRLVRITCIVSSVMKGFTFHWEQREVLAQFFLYLLNKATAMQMRVHPPAWIFYGVQGIEKFFDSLVVF